MSGHSKWHSIRRSKAILDNKRGAVFTRIAREITVAVREGGSGDADSNFRLRMVLQKAKAENMPADNIDRAIKRGLGTAEGEAADEEIMYEGYGPGGCAILVKTYTNNRNRTASEIRSAFTKGGGNFGESGSVAWMFQHRGVIRLAIGKNDPEEMELAAIDAGADDVRQDTDEDDNPVLEIYTTFEDWKKVQEAMENAGYQTLSSEDVMLPVTTMDLEPAKTLQALKLIDRLDDLDDVQNVYTNLNVSEEVAAMEQ
ncbi:MAG TPA: YebC/PmpR family DNA-binding transcriptional regulator [Chloroflexia bacterium]|nr:YebC/PmpR family DNA-binding transcriptional regulator [Chloroflexia bacterium]